MDFSGQRDPVFGGKTFSSWAEINPVFYKSGLGLFVELLHSTIFCILFAQLIHSKLPNFQNEFLIQLLFSVLQGIGSAGMTRRAIVFHG